MTQGTVSKLIFIAIAGLLALSAFAQEYMPFPEARINEAQWRSYLEKVKSSHGDSKRAFPDEYLVIYEDRKGGMFWAFTTPQHPAHPAWITRQIAVDQSGQTKVNQSGYFAGQEQAFAKLFNDYLTLTERTKKNLQNGRDGDKQQVAHELSFKSAMKLVEDSNRKPGYQEYLKEFNEYNNRVHLGAKGGCYLLAQDDVQLIIVITDKGLIESAATDVDNEKAKCYRRVYVGVSVKKPPYSPLAIRIVNVQLHD
jgi:flagellar motor protein MotB